MQKNIQKNLFQGLALMVVMLAVIQVSKGQVTSRCVNSNSNWNQTKTAKKKTSQYWIDPKFTATERQLIKTALDLAVERIQDKSIWQTVKDNYGFAHPKTKTLTEAGICNNINNRRNLLFHQLSQLTETDDIYSKRQFPQVLIHYRDLPPKKGKVGWVGYAYYNRVNIYWDYANRSWKQRGSFSIYLNKHYLRQNGIYKDEVFWAGTIAHEMLHNLGHQHPKADHKDYKKFQINVLANAIRSFGQRYNETAGDIEYPTHLCQSKSKGNETAGDN